MYKQSLSGSWDFEILGSGTKMQGHLPGCNFLDLRQNDVIPDPFWGDNEKTLTDVAEKDYRYSCKFQLQDDCLQHSNIDLILSGVDLFAVITLNGTEISRTDNAHRTWRIPVKEHIKPGDNEIAVTFESTLPYMQKRQKETPLQSSGMGMKGVSFLRKPAYHFGWDWGPSYPPAGITGEITVEAYNGRLTETVLLQEHQDGNVTLHMESKAELPGATGETCIRYMLRGPDGSEQHTESILENGKTAASIEVENPQLWWSHGLGEQPLYTVRAVLCAQDGTILDEWQRMIGLRTIELDTGADEWGSNFRFAVNGVSLFAKGADWIPTDSFVTRTTRKELEFYIKSARNANMNMLRVWGGGYYESDDFYDLCDRYGILVWQDFAFACMTYPLWEQELLDNVHAEVIDNMHRLRHHASLALWCGNNEIQVIPKIPKLPQERQDAEDRFFYETLKNWAQAEDSATPYWPGSPNSGSTDISANSLNEGDTHLWQVWHGMLPVESFRDYPTRFCSEFGMESLPAMKTVRAYTDEQNLNIFSPVVLAHQKAKMGNEKMLYYLLAKYRNPKSFEDTIYLTQLVQAETVRIATEQWRQRMGRCNGSLYWQFNDCWPVASWASIDYEKQYKALQYRARHFNKMIIVSADMRKRDCDIFIINDYPEAFTGALVWSLRTFDGKTIKRDVIEVSAGPTSAQKQFTLCYAEALGSYSPNEIYLSMLLKQDTELLSHAVLLLVPDRQARLPLPNIQVKTERRGDAVTITLTSDKLARYVYLEAEHAEGPLSDNFFDLEPGLPHTVTCTVPQSEELKLHTKSLAGVEYKGNKLDDKRLRLAMLTKKANLMSRIIFKHFLK